MCKTTLIINSAVTTPRNIFCFLCDFSESHSAHGQSRNTKIHDTPNIKEENTKIHGSIHSGINGVCAISGANKPTTDKNIGNTQQNRCGKTDAIIPNLTALFFIIYFLLLVPRLRINGVLFPVQGGELSGYHQFSLSCALRAITKIGGVPSRIRICI